MRAAGLLFLYTLVSRLPLLVGILGMERIYGRGRFGLMGLVRGE